MAIAVFSFCGTPKIVYPCTSSAGDFLSPDGHRKKFITIAFKAKHQCLKWRMPVKTMAMPASSAASMTCWSLMLPPG
jgi:hypothetical protein